MRSSRRSALAAARLAEALAANGDVAQGLHVLERAAAALAQAGATHWANAHFHAVCGDVDDTWRELEAACAGRESNTESVSVDPYFASLHDDPRWPALLRRHGMPQVAGETRAHSQRANG